MSRQMEFVEQETKKPTLNDMRKEYGLDPIPEGNITLTKKKE